MKNCYFQGCSNNGTTIEHIPPKSFFSSDQRTNLLTVKSCEEHNNEKSNDDLYILMHICLNSSPKNGAKEIFIDRGLPQLEYNERRLANKLLENSEQLENGVLNYGFDLNRFNSFFTTLSCGLIFKICNNQSSKNYNISHFYPNFESNNEQRKLIESFILNSYDDELLESLDFGKPKIRNEVIYGLKRFKSSIIIIHEFNGHFKVVSMLTNILER